MDVKDRVITDWVSGVDHIRDLLQLSRTVFPAPPVLYRSFKGVPISV